MTEQDIQYMKRAISLAERGKGWVNPNPLVGAVIVRNGKVIGEGWHERYGELHAERNAFKNCTEDPAGATMYVTLEPCCHYGKTPPCTEAIIEHKIAKVCVGILDPNPLVAGKGVRMLQEAGIEVEHGILEDEIRYMDRVFLKYITTGTPWVVLKSAMTLDGKIATSTGDSRWVSGDEARQLVHRLRSERTGIMVGATTAKVDDPMLNCRLESDRPVRQPIRIIVSSAAKIALESNIARTARQYKTLVAHTEKAERSKIEALNAIGIETIACPEAEGTVDLTFLMKELGKRKIDSLLVEGGGTINYSLLSLGLADEYYGFIAPKMVGGRCAPTPIGGRGIELMKDAVELEEVRVSRCGADILVNGLIKKK